MATIEEALYTLVTTDTAVAALMSTRLYPIYVPEKSSLPAASYQMITTSREYDQSGAAGFASPRIQITITGRTYSEAKSVGNAIRAAINGYRGTVGTVVIFGIFLENEYDGSSNLETGFSTLRQDYRTNWRE